MRVSLVILSLFAIQIEGFVPLQQGRSSSQLHVEPLAKENEWAAYLDEETTGLVYYFNEQTGESLWEPPTKTFPSIRLSGSKRKAALAVQEQYNQAREAEEKNKKGFFGSVFGRKGNDEEKSESSTTTTGTTTEGSSFFGKKDRDERPASAEKPVMVETDTFQPAKKAGLFGKQEEPINGEAPVAAKTAETGNRRPRLGLGKVLKVLKRDRAPITVREPLSIDVSQAILPHPAKTSWGGEDAAFSKGRTFGVFDGVSGADKLDGVPLYSKTMAEELKYLIPDTDEGLTTTKLSKLMLEAAEFADKAATGASTAVVASITKDGFLRVLNLGDSVCVLVRDNAVKAKTKEIIHYFDCPFQLGEDSPDRPRDATKLNVEVLKGDTIVMGSDGVFDNLNDNAICQAVADGGPSSTMAKRIVNLSRQVSLDENADTPYARQAKNAGLPEYKNGKGGKLDDISCIVVQCS